MWVICRLQMSLCVRLCVRVLAESGVDICDQRLYVWRHNQVMAMNGGQEMSTLVVFTSNLELLHNHGTFITCYHNSPSLSLPPRSDYIVHLQKEFKHWSSCASEGTQAAC